LCLEAAKAKIEQHFAQGGLYGKRSFCLLLGIYLDMKPSRNHLFVLRAWLEDGRWRYSLMRSGESERIGFSNLDSLYLYLSSITQEPGQASQKPNSEETE
jgi:hypothetical protein